MYAIRSIQEYTQEIGRYRGSNKGTLCLSILCDSIFTKLYSFSFSDVFSSKAITHFIEMIYSNAVNSFSTITFAKCEQQFNLPESYIRTLLILLENAGFIRIDIEFNNFYVIIPFHSDQVQLFSQC